MGSCEISKKADEDARRGETESECGGTGGEEESREGTYCVCVDNSRRHVHYQPREKEVEADPELRKGLLIKRAVHPRGPAQQQRQWQQQLAGWLLRNWASEGEQSESPGCLGLLSSTESLRRCRVSVLSVCMESLGWLEIISCETDFNTDTPSAYLTYILSHV